MNSTLNTNITLQRTISQSSEYKDELKYVKKCESGVLFEGSRIAVSAPKVSIVIPVYNKVKYLDLALRSAQNQTMRNIEIVCVDDGSTDESVAKIESYMKDDPRIRLIKHEKNEGTLKARCDGVRAAKGEFIMPLDPDDAFCSPKIAELAYNKAKEVGADIVHYRRYNYIDNKFTEKSWGSPTEFTKHITQPELFDVLMRKHTCCFKLIGRELYTKALNLIGEDTLMKHVVYVEDMLQMTVIGLLASKYIGLNVFGYVNFMNEDSSMRQLDKFPTVLKRAHDFVIVANKLLDITKSKFKDKVELYLYANAKSSIRLLSKFTSEQSKKISDMYINNIHWEMQRKEDLKISKNISHKHNVAR